MQVTDLIEELMAAGSKELAVSTKPGCVERLRAYARSVAHFPTAVKEFEWRNGWFDTISKSAVAAGVADPCPQHSKWLSELRT